jgi:REP element-mobilizing transposase RayT
MDATPESRKLTWHVYARGARRLQLFYEDDDFLTFLGLLKKALDRTGVAMWAYVLMSNHYHFVVTATADELTGFMRWVNHSYSIYHNRKHGFKGHTFEGPYRAHVQPTLFLALYRIAYVFLNPVDAHMADRPEDYRWSSYRAFMGLPGAPLWLDPTPVLQMLADNFRDARAEFHDILERQDRFPKRVVQDKLTWTELAAGQFEPLLAEAERRKGRLAGEDPVLVAMYWGRKAGIPPRAMRPALPPGSPRYISKVLGKFIQRIESDEELKTLLSPP